MCLREGMCQGVRALLEEALLIAREMHRHAQLAQPRTQVVCLLQLRYSICHATEINEFFLMSIFVITVLLVTFSVSFICRIFTSFCFSGFTKP